VFFFVPVVLYNEIIKRWIYFNNNNNVIDVYFSCNFAVHGWSKLYNTVWFGWTWNILNFRAYVYVSTSPMQFSRYLHNESEWNLWWISFNGISSYRRGGKSQGVSHVFHFQKFCLQCADIVVHPEYAR